MELSMVIGLMELGKMELSMVIGKVEPGKMELGKMVVLSLTLVKLIL